jgi:vanillate/3-O-methylgallate O-demethylase
MMLPSPFRQPAAIPYYPRYGLFSLSGGQIRQW